MDVKSDQETLSVGRIALAKMISMDWIAEHKKHILYAASIVLISLFFLLPIGKRFSGSGADYSKVESAYAAWSQQEKQDPLLFKEVSDPLARHPELVSKFGTLIAQRMLSLGETHLAQEFGKASLMRTKALLSPYHMLFSENTFLISQGNLKEALLAAYHLKNTMGADEQLWTKAVAAPAGKVLYAYNLLRIASLEREVGTRANELKTWEEMMQNAGWGGAGIQGKMYDPDSYQLLANNFKDGEISLFEYIQQRKRI